MQRPPTFTKANLEKGKKVNTPKKEKREPKKPLLKKVKNQKKAKKLNKVKKLKNKLYLNSNTTISESVKNLIGGPQRPHPLDTTISPPAKSYLPYTNG